MYVHIVYYSMLHYSIPPQGPQPRRLKIRRRLSRRASVFDSSNGNNNNDTNDTNDNENSYSNDDNINIDTSNNNHN